MKKGSLFFLGFFVVSGYLFLSDNPAWAQTCGGIMPGSIHHGLVFGNFTRNIEYGGITAGARPGEEETSLEMARRFRRGNPPGPAGGPGAAGPRKPKLDEDVNPPGPAGGPGADPKKPLLDKDDNAPGPAGGPGTNWENPPGPKGGSGASPD